MANPAEREQQVIDIETYLRETISDIDHSIAEMQRHRTGLAVRLAGLIAARDPSLARAADDYARRVETDTPYEDAQDANALIMEAHQRFLKP